MSNKKDTINRLNVELLRQTLQQADELTIPQSLLPQNINALLEGKVVEQRQQEQQRFTVKKRTRTICYSALSVAAAFILIFAVGIFKPSMLYSVDFVESAQDYNQIYRAIESTKYKDSETLLTGIKNHLESRMDTDKSVSSSESFMLDTGNMLATGASNYSATNEQVVGVSEGDIVKTNGNAIYALSRNGSLNILAPQTKSQPATILQTLPAAASTCSVADMILSDQNVTVILQDYNEQPEVQAMIYQMDQQGTLTLSTQYTQQGSYLSSRTIDNALYIASSYVIPADIVASDAATYVPSIQKDSQAAACVAPADITITPTPDTPQYVVLTGVDLTDSTLPVQSKSVLGSGYEVYCSVDNFYVMGSQNEETTILKFGLDQGKISFEATANVNGSPLNQFSADEYNGYFRIATTSSKQGNALYILDEQLKQVSSLTDLAQGERIYSCRFMGDTAYMVTFRQTDPLFVISLADPKNPQVTGQLKLPGFSNYLHPIGENLLLGIGRNTTSDGSLDGYKMSLFDVSAPTAPVEIDRVIVAGNSQSAVSANHKAFFFDLERNLIGYPFMAQRNDGTSTFNGYVFYSIENNQFKLLSKLEIPQDVPQEDDFDIGYEKDYYSSSLNDYASGFAVQRGFFVGDSFYLYTTDELAIYDYPSLAYLDTIHLQ